MRIVRAARARAWSMCARLMPVGLLLAISGVTAFGQSLPPNNTECSQWDAAYAQIVLFGVVGSAIGALVMSLLVGVVFGRQFWWAAQPRRRIWITAFGLVFPLTLLLIVGLPRLTGFGRFFFSGIEPRYVQCSTVAFGGEGLFRGLVGAGVSVYAQWQFITAFLLAGCAVGGVGAFLLSEAIVRSSGLEANARRGEL